MPNSPPGLSFNGAMPFFWMHEISGKMKEIVRKFFNEEDFNEWELETFRWYIFQWVEAMPSRPADYARIRIMSQSELKDYILGPLLDAGIDPL